MILYYSGGSAGGNLPEEVLTKAEDEVSVMLTYHEIREKNSSTVKRFKRHRKQRRKGNKKK